MAGRAPAHTVAFAPVATMAVAPELADAYERSLAREIARAGVRLAPAARLREALGAEADGAGPCADSDACLARAGRAAGADLVLSVAVAGLGDVWMVRARVLKARDGLPLQDLRETVDGGRPAVERQATRLARRLFPPPAPRPWYRQPWFWSSVTVAAVTAVAVPFAIADDGPEVVPIGSL